MDYKFVQYMCSYCGKKQTMRASMGRPLPGICTKKGKTSDGRTRPHSWRVNLKY